MKQMEIHFTECEHEGDFDQYASDLRNSGAQELSGSINYDTETCTICVSVEDEVLFLDKFEETESFDFSNL